MCTVINSTNINNSGRLHLELQQELGIGEIEILIQVVFFLLLEMFRNSAYFNIIINIDTMVLLNAKKMCSVAS